MSRPMSSARAQFIQTCQALGSASAHQVAAHTGLPLHAIKQAASNALRSGDVQRSGYARIEGSDRPVTLYSFAESQPRSEPADSRAWFVDLGEICR